jgi:hypothetical protein
VVLAKCDEDEAPSTVRDVAPDSRAACRAA